MIKSLETMAANRIVCLEFKHPGGSRLPDDALRVMDSPSFSFWISMPRELSLQSRSRIAFNECILHLIFSAQRLKMHFFSRSSRFTLLVRH
jgi:hypothetical protein